MQNEELTKELNLLQDKFNKEIEDVKKKYEKPMFEVGKYIAWIDEINFYAAHKDCLAIIVKDMGEDVNVKWISKTTQMDGVYSKSNFYLLNTSQEVESALTKEAVKRGFKEGVKFKPVTPNVHNETIATCNDTFKYWDKPLHGHDAGLSSNKNWIFQNGTWAEIIKEKTLDELASELSYTTLEDIKHKLIKNKQEVINILNNL